MTTLTSPAAQGQRRALCHALDVVPATCYRARGQAVRATVTPRRPAPARALTTPERAQVIAVLHDDRFVDLAQAQVYATPTSGFSTSAGARDNGTSLITLVH